MLNHKIVVIVSIITLIVCLLPICYATEQASLETRTEAATVILPFRAIGIDPTTNAVAMDILGHQLAEKGLTVVSPSSLSDSLPTGSNSCHDPECAGQLALDLGADQVVYGSISRLGEKRIVRVSVLRVSESTPFYMDQISALSEEEIETVMIRIAEGIASGKPNSDQATVESVVEVETLSPRLRHSRRGLGARAGFLFPSNHSFGNADRMTNLRFLYKVESKHHFLETTALTEWLWGDGQLDWTIFSMYGARMFSTKDFTPYAGFGLGIHVIKLEREITNQDNYPYSYQYTDSQTKTTLVVEPGIGLIFLRTYDNELFLDLRYRIVVDKFEEIGDLKAHGIMLTFGTNR